MNTDISIISGTRKLLRGARAEFIRSNRKNPTDRPVGPLGLRTGCKVDPEVTAYVVALGQGVPAFDLKKA